MRKRSAEKARLSSSCTFADRLARASIVTFRSVCPRYLQDSYEQTVLATVVLQIPVGDRHGLVSREMTVKSVLRVVSIGVGTKVLDADRIVSEKEANRSTGSNKGDRLVRDMHAEILAKRGFRRFLYSALENVKRSSYDEYNIFQRNEMSGSYELRDDIKIHMYTSSMPCGNACIKRWAKTKRAEEYSSLGYDEFPVHGQSYIHHNFSVIARHEGQVAVLTKVNCNHHRTEEETIGEHTDKSMNLLQSDGVYYPIGTAPVKLKKGNVMTCSDKLAMTNALGLQGALLDILLNQDRQTERSSRGIYLDSIVIGRKFSETIGQRALCCRINHFKYPCNHLLRYKTHHPAILCTTVKFDEKSIVVLNNDSNSNSNSNSNNNNNNEINVESNNDNENKNDTNAATQATFHERRCFVAWTENISTLSCFSPSLVAVENHEDIDELLGVIDDFAFDHKNYNYEVLDSQTGFAVDREASINTENPCDDKTVISRISSFALFELFSKLYIQKESNDSSLDYESTKKTIAMDYHAAKRILVEDKKLFGDWIHK